MQIFWLNLEKICRKKLKSLKETEAAIDQWSEKNLLAYIVKFWLMKCVAYIVKNWRKNKLLQPSEEAAERCSLRLPFP